MPPPALDPESYLEAQALARLTHPNVVAVHDVGTWEGRVFVAMEFVHGLTLGKWMRQATRTPIEIVGVGPCTELPGWV